MNIPSTESPLAAALPSHTWRIVRTVFGLAGLSFALLAIQGSWSEVEITSWSPVATFTAALLIVLTTLMGARVWAILADGSQSRARASYYSALIGKYIPGGIFQAVGQVGYATQTGLSVGSAARTLAVSMVTTGAAGLILASSGSLITSFNPMLRIALAVGGVAGLVLLKRSVLDTLARGVMMIIRRQPADSPLPPQNKIIMSAAWALGGLSLLAASFTVVARQVEPSIPIIATTAALSVAWIAGFIAVPFPAGIGVREAVLVGLLSQSAPGAIVIAISLAHRLITVAAETFVYLISRRQSARPT